MNKWIFLLLSATVLSAATPDTKTEKEVLAAKVTAPWDTKTAGGLGAAGAGLTSADRFVSEVYQELKGGAK